MAIQEAWIQYQRSDGVWVDWFVEGVTNWDEAVAWLNRLTAHDQSYLRLNPKHGVAPSRRPAWLQYMRTGGVWIDWWVDGVDDQHTAQRWVSSREHAYKKYYRVHERLQRPPADHWVEWNDNSGMNRGWLSLETAVTRKISTLAEAREYVSKKHSRGDFRVNPAKTTHWLEDRAPTDSHEWRACPYAYAKQLTTRAGAERFLHLHDDGKNTHYRINPDRLNQDASSPEPLDSGDDASNMRESKTMNYTTAILLVNKSVKVVGVSYDRDPDNKGIGPWTPFKTLDPNIEVGDLVIVPTNTRHKLTVARVEELDVEIELDSPKNLQWLVSSFDTVAYEDVVQRELEVIAKIKSAEKTRARQELADKLLEDNPDLAKFAELGASGPAAITAG